jgi:hypothetical protein
MSIIKIYYYNYPYGIMQELTVLEAIANGLVKEVVEGLKRDTIK